MRTDSRTWRISPVAWVPIATAVAAEAISNALRAYGLGMHLDRFTVPIEGQPVSLAGAVLVLAAIAVSLSQARAAWVALTPQAPARQRIVAALAAILLLAISVTAMASHILEAQRAKVTDEGGERGRFDRAQTAYSKAADELVTLAGTRTIAEVRAAMDAAPVERQAFARTRQCTDVTREDSFQACKPILVLRQEMAKAIRKHELEPEAARLKAELAGLKRPEAAAADEAAVAGVWAWIMGFGVVFVATFGAVIFARAVPVPPVTANDNGSVVPVPPGSTHPETGAPAVGAAIAGGTDPVVDWIREFRARHGRNPQIPELQATHRLPKTTAWRRIKAA